MIRPVQMDATPTRPWHVKETSIYGANDQLVATVGVFTSKEDSALIAAGPRMLTALKTVRADDLDTAASWDEVRAVIELAEGR